jgi:crotonobetainyl-CoA:carnitine CoA-transferase CaiB-like acyl-CoA transferase
VLPLLSEITVFEIANTVAPAYAGRLLADLGARVVTIEPPGGNRLRARSDVPNLADYLAANKLSATLDFEVAGGPALAGAICAAADIILYDASSPYFDSYLLEQELYRQSPVVLAVVTPYGLQGQHARLHEDELLMFALTGIASETPEEAADRSVERPMQLPGEQAQFVGGLTAAVSALQGWYSMRQRGESVLLDISVLDALASVPIISQAAVFAGHPPPKGPSLRPQTVPRGMIRCRDGYVYTQGGDDNWLGWARVVGRSEWSSPPFTEPEYREAHWQALGESIQEWLDQHSSDEVYRACQEAGITAFPVNTIGQVVAHPQTVARDVFRSIQRDSGDFMAPRTPFRVLAPRFDEGADVVRRLGADNERVRALLALEIGAPDCERNDGWDATPGRRAHRRL